jgi:hypothetical protein
MTKNNENLLIKQRTGAAVFKNLKNDRHYRIEKVKIV